jgi:hypothetical protein
MTVTDLAAALRGTIAKKQQAAIRRLLNAQRAAAEEYDAVYRRALATDSATADRMNDAWRCYLNAVGIARAEYDRENANALFGSKP